MLQERDEVLIQSSKRERSSHYFNSFFMDALYTNDRAYNYRKVRRWSRKVKKKIEFIFLHDLLFLSQFIV